jgi:hypothetical protein
VSETWNLGMLYRLFNDAVSPTNLTQAVIILIYIREVPGSNFCRYTGCPEVNSGLLQSLQANTWIMPLIMTRQFPSTSHPIVIHLLYSKPGQLSRYSDGLWAG